MVAASPVVFHVPPSARGHRLDAFLAAAAEGLTRSRVQALISQGRVRVDGAAAKPALRLRGGERVELDVPPPVPAEAAPEELPLTVLYEDADVVVIDKAAGMVVHPAAGHARGTLVNALLHRLVDLQGIGGELRPGIVHRLDKDTSGVIVIAKNELALTGLQSAFKARTVDKRYLALVHGVPRPAGTIRTLYGRHPVHRKRFTGKLEQGKPAVTHFQVLEFFGEVSLVEVALETGRTHQIRVHLSELGHPLLADTLYGGRRRASERVQEAARAIGRQALHAAALTFSHPRTGERVHAEAPLPADFRRAVQVLRHRGS